MHNKEYEIEIGGKKITALFSDLANQANGSVILKSEGTVVMATAVISKDGKRNPGFFNLTVDYLEKFYAVGKILGSQFNHREAKPADQAFLSARMTDRTIRPLFDQRMKNAVQIIITIIAVGKSDPKVLGINAVSVALHTSDIPWKGPVGAVHVSKAKGSEEVKINDYIPTDCDPVYDLELLVCGKDKTINMIESMAFETKEEDMGNYFDLAIEEISKWEIFQEMLRRELGKEKIVIPIPEIPTETISIFDKKIKPILTEKLFSDKSKEVSHEARVLWQKIVDEKYEDKDILEKNVAEDYFHDYLDKEFHKKALEENIRADGRKLDEIRSLFVKAGGISDTLHGSGIFYRGETHVMSILTLGGPESQQKINNMEGTYKRRFMHHYNFPPYSAGETGRVGMTNRRELGHGYLAEKALIPVLPEITSFPYTIRVVSESTASNGSTSQASICALTTALLDGGVPIKKPVAGISVGLMSDEKDVNKYVLLSDIQGPEDHYGDMDFKVAGTRDGITAIQLDIKVGGVPSFILKEALTQARQARLKILDTIANEISEPRKNISENAPKIMTVQIKKDQIGLIIGPGGKTINEIREETETEITIEEDGTVFITGKNGGTEKAVKIIEEMTHEYKVGDTAKATVVKIMDFGAFVRIGRDTEGLVHISEIAPFRVEKVSDMLKEGDIVPIKIIKTDDKGRLSFSIKEADSNFFKKAE